MNDDRFSTALQAWARWSLRRNAQGADLRLQVAECHRGCLLWKGQATLFMWQRVALGQPLLPLSSGKCSSKDFFSTKKDVLFFNIIFTLILAVYYDMPTCSFPCAYSFWNSPSSLNLGIYVFHQFWKLRCLIFSNTVSISLSLSSLGLQWEKC